jgi:hypothetical protein
MKLLGTEDDRYSLKTLRALLYGATYGGVSSHGTLHITFTDDEGVREGNILAAGPSGIVIRTPDGALRSDISSACIVHAEVI